MDIPSIDQNSKLKIEEEPVELEEVTEGEKKSRVMFWLGTVFSLLIIGTTLYLGYYYMHTPVITKDIVTIDSIPTAAPVPTEVTVKLNKDAITFEVQNATGTAGVGARNKTKLESLGYKVVSVGNATGKHVGVELYLTSVEQKDLILADLKNDFPSVNYVGALSDSTASARLIIGK